MALSIEITAGKRLSNKLYELSTKTHEKYNEELEMISEILYRKVAENLSGKILPEKTGDLKRSIKKEVFISGYDFIAFVGPVPATPKAWALEMGGKGSYLIPLGPKNLLANKETGFFSRHPVTHPSSKEYMYLREAFEEIKSEIPSQLTASIDGMFRNVVD